MPFDLTPDPAGSFAAALSLHNAIESKAKEDPSINLSDDFQGCDQFLRICMQVGTMFEEWACKHVDFNQLTDVWPYLLQDSFGEAVLAHLMGSWADLSLFNTEDCLAVARRLNLKIHA